VQQAQQRKNNPQKFPLNVWKREFLWVGQILISNIGKNDFKQLIVEALHNSLHREDRILRSNRRRKHFAYDFPTKKFVLMI
jgi:hypothetical protein